MPLDESNLATCIQICSRRYHDATSSMSSQSAHNNLLKRLRANRLQDQVEAEAEAEPAHTVAERISHKQHQRATAHFIRSSLAHFYRHQRGARPKRVA